MLADQILEVAPSQPSVTPISNPPLASSAAKEIDALRNQVDSLVNQLTTLINQLSIHPCLRFFLVLVVQAQHISVHEEILALPAKMTPLLLVPSLIWFNCPLM